MNLSNSIERANNVKGEKSAAKLYADIEFELAMGEPSFEDEHAGEEALSTLEGQYPGIKAASDEVVELGHQPAMSRKARGNAHVTEDEPKPNPNPPSAPTATPRARAAVQGRRQTRQAARSAFRSTGIPAITGGSGSIGLQALGALTGLSLAYLLLTSKGTIGLGRLLQGITTGANVFVTPTDPFAKRSTTVSAATSAAAAKAVAATTAAAAGASSAAGALKTAAG